MSTTTSAGEDVFELFESIFGSALFDCASATKSPKRGRPPDPRLIELDDRLIEIVEEHQPITVRGVFYQAVVLNLITKEENGVRLIGRRLLQLRREGAIPYSWIVDESRDVHGYRTYGGLNDLAGDVAQLYRRDYWRSADCWVQIWIEKRALAGVLQPIVADLWGLNLYVCGGQPSESYLYRAGLDIKNRGAQTHVYVLSDFDPAGDTIFKTLAYGTKGMQGGLSRFAGGVPVHVHKLALTHDQVKEMGLPTRPAKKSDTRSRRFIKQFGDISVELDAIPPNDLRNLVDGAISQHMNQRELQALKKVESEEKIIAKIGIEDARDDIERARWGGPA